MATHADLVGASEQRRADARNRLMAEVDDLDLSEPEIRTLEWLLRWETETVENIVATLRKARAAGHDAGCTKSAGHR